MGSNILKLLKYHSASFFKDLDHCVAKAAKEALKLRNPTLELYDETFTRIAGGTGPPFPFETAEAYYIWGSSHHVINKITVPFLAINSSDDPIVRHVPMDGGGNGLVVMVLTQGGGHLGWFQRGSHFIERWTTKPVLEWLKIMGEGLLHDKFPSGLETWFDKDGFLRAKSRPHLGCRVIREGEIIDGNGGEEGMLRQFSRSTPRYTSCGRGRGT